ncbi:MAG: hypothetical protein R3Y39_08860, partial [Rikenellaceae bacterium]
IVSKIIYIKYPPLIYFYAGGYFNMQKKFGKLKYYYLSKKNSPVHPNFLEYDKYNSFCPNPTPPTKGKNLFSDKISWLR